MKYKVNDQIPDSEVFRLIDGSPKKFQMNEFFKNNKSILLGMPGAFTSVCSNKHLPSYKDNIDKIRSKGVDKVFCISVNDPYVMNAWAKVSKVENDIIMLADPFGHFANKLGVLVNKEAKGLGMRSSRYTMIIENEVIKYVAIENETGICELSAADNVLSKL
jgi:peroxiredoxin (alkyl hydroperoxide reductase subunit C)